MNNNEKNMKSHLKVMLEVAKQNREPESFINAIDALLDEINERQVPVDYPADGKELYEVMK